MKSLYLKTVRIAAANIAKMKPGEPIKVSDLENNERLMKVGDMRPNQEGDLIVQLFIEK